MADAAPNPFVGPRPLERGEKIYGRDREIRDLDNLIAAERIVVLHAPSGAGKSSMIQAGLMPRLLASFDVWGATRVHQLPSIDGTAAGYIRNVNRYTLSAVQGLEQAVPERLRRSTGFLAGQSLREYAEKRPRRRSAPHNVLIIFDQFEEILTVDPLAEDAKRQFFSQLGELLRNRRFFALFSLREDYLAPLDPYAQEVPTHLGNRFRMDLLGLDGAREAIVRPAQAGGREFPAADRLIQDLATTQVQQPDGSFAEETGRHVEPVQLQVVCYRLWDALPADQKTIQDHDLELFGDVSQALGAYYADSVGRLAAGDDAHERRIRDWFNEKLITAGGIRGQVLRGAGESDGLDNETIEALLDTHLVRSEKRAGATWYELAHDRLIEPVKNDNAEWLTDHLSKAQQRAALWERQGRSPGLLLRDEELTAAERWAANAAAVTEVEQEYLAASREAQAAAERERRQTSRIRRLAWVASLVGILALVAGAFAFRLMLEAEKQRLGAEMARDEAVRQREAAQTQQELAEKARQEADQQRREAEEQRATAQEQQRLAVAAQEDADKQRRVAEEQRSTAEVQRQAAEANAEEARQQRQAAEVAQAKAEEAQAHAEKEHDEAERAKELADQNATAADRLRLLAEADALAERTRSMTSEAEREVAALLAVRVHRLHGHLDPGERNPVIYDALRRTRDRLMGQAPALLGHRAEVRSLRISDDGQRIAAGAEDGAILWAPLRETPVTLRPLANLGEGIRALAWSPSGPLTGQLAAGTVRGRVVLWDSNLGNLQELALLGSNVNTLAFEPGGSRLAAGGDGLRIWNLAQGGEPELHPQCRSTGREPLRELAWAGTSLAAACDGQGVLLWSTDSDFHEAQLLKDEPNVRSVALGPDGRSVFAGTDAGVLVRWDLTGDTPGAPLRLPGHTARVEALAMDPAGVFLASASLDGSVRLWDAAQPSSQPLVLSGHSGWVWAVAFSSTDGRVVSGGADRALRLWETDPDVLVADICQRVTRSLSAEERREHLHAGADIGPACPKGNTDE